MLQAFDVAGDQIDLEIDPAAGLEVLQVGDRERVRYQVDFEILAFHAVDGEADAVYRDRAFARDVFGQILRRADDEEEALARGLRSAVTSPTPST